MGVELRTRVCHGGARDRLPRRVHRGRAARPRARAAAADDARPAHHVHHIGLVEVDGDTVRALPAADAVAETIREAERERLRRYVAEWPDGDEPEVAQLVEQLTHELMADNPRTA
jgi:hypothetical protein